MPRSNPLECFMSGPVASRSRDRSEESPGAPPDTPRSDIQETNANAVQDKESKRPSTAPSKRLLSSSTPPGGRPRSARIDSVSPSINIMKDESENKENVNNTLVEKLIFLQNGLFITGKGVIVTLKGFKTPPPQKKESVLPSVTGVSVPTMRYKKTRDLIEESSIINQPPPTPVGQLSIKGDNDHVHFLENSKSPMPEETSDNRPENTQTDDNAIVKTDTNSTNMEMTVKIIQLSGNPNETVVVYDKTKTGAAEDTEAINNDLFIEHNGDLNNDESNSLKDFESSTKKNADTKINSNEVVNDTNFKENEKENNIESTTFITEKENGKTQENTRESKNVLSFPNAKLDPKI